MGILAALQTTTGVTSDLQQATSLARHMVTQCGMSTEFGPVYVSENGRSSSDFGPEMQRRVDNEISRILHDSYSRVQTLLVSRFTVAMNAVCNCPSDNSDHLTLRLGCTTMKVIPMLVAKHQKISECTWLAAGWINTRGNGGCTCLAVHDLSRHRKCSLLAGVHSYMGQSPQVMECRHSKLATALITAVVVPSDFFVSGSEVSLALLSRSIYDCHGSDHDDPDGLEF